MPAGGPASVEGCDGPLANRMFVRYPSPVPSAAVKGGPRNGVPPAPTREVILDTAERLFAARGVEGVAVRDLAREMGITASSLYNHFPGKQALYDAVLARGLGPIVETVAVAWQDGLGPERVHATLDRLTAHLARHPHPARLLQRALLEESPAVQALPERRIGSLHREGTAVVRTAARDALYHLALAIGDLSALYLDEDDARKTRWGTLIAPPIIVQTMDTLRAVGHSGLPEGLPGVHSIWTGSLYEWERAVKLGDRLRADCYLKSLTEKESTFGGGRALYQTYEAVSYDQDGRPAGLRQHTRIRHQRTQHD